MNKYLVLMSLFLSISASAQGIFGKWTTIDDKTKEKKSIVEIYERDGEVFGKIVEIFNPAKRNLPCVYCKGSDYNKPILGLEIIKNMTKDGQCYKNGVVINPENGKTYKLKLTLSSDNKDILQVRGYVGFFYRTQYWQRTQ